MGATDAKVAEVHTHHSITQSLNHSPSQTPKVRRFFSLDDGVDQLQWEQALNVFDKVCKAFDHEMLRQQRTHEKVNVGVFLMCRRSFRTRTTQRRAHT